MHFCLLAQLAFKLELFLLKHLSAGDSDKNVSHSSFKKYFPSNKIHKSCIIILRLPNQLLLTSRPHLSFPYNLIWMCFIFFSWGPTAPLRTALWMPPGKWAPHLSFPSRAFCTFNHVTLSWADYRHLNSLEKVRAGIRASWGIRNPNWFQLSLPPNDQFFGRIDGAEGLYVRGGR